MFLLSPMLKMLIIKKMYIPVVPNLCSLGAPRMTPKIKFFSVLRQN